MQVLALDFESYWSAEYSLTKMTPLEYVLDPRWEAHSLTIATTDLASVTAIGDAEIRLLVAKYDWSQCMVIGHNMSGFDAYVAAYRYGIKPKLWGCTLAMARPIFQRTVGASLKALCLHFGIGLKDDRILQATKGRRLRDFTAQEVADMRVYNKDDAVFCMQLFQRLKGWYDANELWQIDCLIRMRTEPMFEVHKPTLEDALEAERVRQSAALAQLAHTLGVEAPDTISAAEAVRSVLASPVKMRQFLEERGVDVPMKASPTNPDTMIPALAKSDVEFVALQEHDDPVVAAAVTLRLDVKSTLTQTRIEAFLKAANLTGGSLPIPLRYCGAVTTGRDSGEEYNPLNMTRIDKKVPKPSDALRNSLEAPPGYAIVVVDFSSIELRVNHYLWQVRKTMRLFNEDPKADLYTVNAQDQLGRLEISKNERQVEKAKQLGLGFGAGAYTFKRVARGMGLVLTDQQAQEYVTLWRADHPEIAGKGGGWALCDAALTNMASGCEEYWLDPWGLVAVTPEGFGLPSGRMIRYPQLRRLQDGEWPDGRVKYTWFYGTGKYARRITGPKGDENVVQALARDAMADKCIDIWRETGFRPSLRVYDEMVYVVPDGVADDLERTCHKHMRTPLDWWPELVLWSEGSVDYCYGAAK